MTERDAFRGPGAWNVDFIVGKRFRFGTNKAALVRLEAYNLFNHHNMYVHSRCRRHQQLHLDHRVPGRRTAGCSSGSSSNSDRGRQRRARGRAHRVSHEGEPHGLPLRILQSACRQHPDRADPVRSSDRVPPLDFVHRDPDRRCARPSGGWSRPVRVVRRGPRHPRAACRRAAGAAQVRSRRGFGRGVVVVDRRSRSRHPAASSTGRRGHHRQLAAVRDLLYHAARARWSIRRRGSTWRRSRR